MGKAWKFGENLNTDEIIPARFNLTIDEKELAKKVFCEVKPAFAPEVKPGDVIVALGNFGCGSSREHAPWSLYDFGLRCIIAPSFADIFYNNCIKNGILLVSLKPKEVDELFKFALSKKGAEITADLEKQTIMADKKIYKFEIDAFNKECLLKGLDQIGWALQFADRIDAYEKQITVEKPWLA